ncbi:MAG: purine-nucleoside phosphorylase [Nocardioidaceae bacterium]
MAEDPYALAERAAGRIADLTGRAAHDALVVLGSGWGPAAHAFGDPVAAFAMTDVPGFLAPVAEGHAGVIRSYDVDGVRTLVLAGRTHLYEGHGLRPVVHGIRAARACGVRLAVLTNANGSLRTDWELGQPVLVADHLNLTATSPLEGARFVDLTDAWSPRLRALAGSIDPSLAEGVYAWLRGPHYETWAEAGWARTVGADLLGMSTVPEAIAARELGVELLGLSTVTAIEGAPSGIDPSDVVAVAERTAARCGPLLVRLLSAAGLGHEGVLEQAGEGQLGGAEQR